MSETQITVACPRGAVKTITKGRQLLIILWVLLGLLALRSNIAHITLSWTTSLKKDNVNPSFSKIPLTHPLSRYPNESAAICSIVVDEEAYLDEWVDYHYGLGFTAFYIYDNSATNELRQWGEEKGVGVVVKPYPGENQQVSSYLDCVSTLAVNHTWAALFDIDEFLVLRRHHHVVDFLHDHVPTGALALNWVFFSNTDQLVYNPLPVTKRFVLRDPEVNQHVKVIVKVADMDATRRQRSPHEVHLKQGQTIDTGGRIVRGPFNPNGPTDVANVYHFHTKSRKEFIAKRMRGRSDLANAGYSRERAEQEADTLIPGTVFDDSAWQLLKEVAPKYRVFDGYEGWRRR